MNVSGNESSTRKVRRLSPASGLAVLALAAALLFPPAVFAAEKASSGKYSNGRPKVEGVDEHLGKFIPLDAQFYDSQGNKVTMGEIMKKPTVLAFFYTRCAGIC
ncbi:MAG: hypothetical protein P8Z49_12740, partial [Acidobacteriota bacterium]